MPPQQSRPAPAAAALFLDPLEGLASLMADKGWPCHFQALPSCGRVLIAIEPCWVGQLREQGLAASRRLLDELGHCEIQLRTLGVKYGQHQRPNRNRPRKENVLHWRRGAVRSARLTGSRSLTRRGHRPPAIERHLLEQAAMFISPMSALKRITDSRET